MRKILHVDLNSFYASVECLLDESLMGKSVAVSGSVSDRHGVVLAKNQKAKEQGIKTGMTVFEAKKLVPDLVICETHFDKYIKYSRAVKSIFMSIPTMLSLLALMRLGLMLQTVVSLVVTN